MGFYRERVLPHLVDLTCGTVYLQRWRSEATAGLEGRVVEIGFGSGLNAAHYPPEVELVLAVEPASLARRMAARRIANGSATVEHVGTDARDLPLEDDSCDCVLSTFTLCTVPEPARVLHEVRRVLRPRGRFHFLEHGLSPQPSVARWQARLDPLQQRLADGCHLTRDAPEMLRSAGFVIERVEQRYAKGPKPWSWFSIGVATNPAGAPHLSNVTERSTTARDAS